MNIIVVLTKDHHIDTEVELFDNVEQAINRAKEIAKHAANNPGDIKEYEVSGSDYLYCVEYSFENGTVLVFERPLIEATT